MGRTKPIFENKDIEKWLKSHGWYFVRQKGSHRHFKHPSNPGLVTVPYKVSLNILKIIEKTVGDKYYGHKR